MALRERDVSSPWRVKRTNLRDRSENFSGFFALGQISRKKV